MRWFLQQPNLVAMSRTTVVYYQTKGNILIVGSGVELDRRLWETAERTGGRPVVGVVGAAHVKGITQAWPTIGSWEGKKKVQDLMQVPAGYDQGSRVVSTTLTGVFPHSSTTLLMHNPSAREAKRESSVNLVQHTIQYINVLEDICRPDARFLQARMV
jgi:hypothetical protein